MALKGVSTPAVVAAGVGALVLWSAIKGAKVTSGFRTLLGGQQPSGANVEPAGGIDISTPQTNNGPPASAAAVPQNTSTNSVIANDALSYVGRGHVYKWGGADPNGWDCSGFCNYVIGHDLQSPIPGVPSGKYTGHGPTTFQWAVFGTKISRKDVQAGDLVIWPTQHMGIAISNSQMVNCPGPNGTPAPVVGGFDFKLAGMGPIFRRIGLTYLGPH